MTLQERIVDTITMHDLSRPRSLQTDVGPSDLGDPCDHCLAAKLAGWRKRPALAWLPYIGTAVHAQLAEAFSQDVEWLTEQKVEVGRVCGRRVWGTADLYHLPTHTVVDFKIVGVNTLRAAKAGTVDEKYRRQVHLYGSGFCAERVAIAFLPRNSPNLARDIIWWEEELNEELAQSTLQRAEDLCNAVSNLTGIGLEKYIATLTRAQGCYDCPRYFDWEDYRPAIPARSIMDGIMK